MLSRNSIVTGCGTAEYLMTSSGWNLHLVVEDGKLEIDDLTQG